MQVRHDDESSKATAARTQMVFNLCAIVSTEQSGKWLRTVSCTRASVRVSTAWFFSFEHGEGRKWRRIWRHTATTSFHTQTRGYTHNPRQPTASTNTAPICVVTPASAPDAVASSRTNTRGLRSSARAKHRSCLSPTLKFSPDSLTSASSAVSPSPERWASLMARSTSVSVCWSKGLHAKDVHTSQGQSPDVTHGVATRHCQKHLHPHTHTHTHTNKRTPDCSGRCQRREWDPAG